MKNNILPIEHHSTMIQTISKKLPKKTSILKFQKIILAWYGKHGRIFPWRNLSATSYEKIIAEILLQRTKAETVAAFFPLFIEKFPSWEKLAEAQEKDIQDLIKPIGLWRQRAYSLHALSVKMVERDGVFPLERADLEKLPGVGQYIASAIRIFIYNQIEPLLDINMQRVLERNFGERELADIRYDPYLQELSRLVVNCEKPIELNFGILDFAAGVCKARNPNCKDCILNDHCQHFLCNTKHWNEYRGES